MVIALAALTVAVPCCEECHRTFCLRHIHVPVVTLPDGFTQTSINYVIKGLCPECAEKLSHNKGK